MELEHVIPKLYFAILFTKTTLHCFIFSAQLDAALQEIMNLQAVIESQTKQVQYLTTEHQKAVNEKQVKEFLAMFLVNFLARVNNPFLESTHS